MNRDPSSRWTSTSDETENAAQPSFSKAVRGAMRRDRILTPPDPMDYLTRLLGGLLAGSRRQEKGTQALAERLLRRFKRLDVIADAPDEDLLDVEGMNHTLLHRLKLVSEYRDALNNSYKRRDAQLATPESVFQLYAPKLRSLHHEVFLALVADDKLHLLHEFRFTELHASRCPVDVRKLFRQLLDVEARRVLFVHNHTDNNPAPSGMDEALTERLTRAARLLDMEVLDHVIISRRAYYSFFDNHKLLPLESPASASCMVQAESVMSETIEASAIYGRQDMPGINPDLRCLHDF